MGLFNRLKKDKKEINTNQPETRIKPAQIQGFEDIQVSYLDEGRRVQIEFYESNPKFGQFYDTTRLIVDRKPHRMANSTVNQCLISWYGQNDAIMVDFDPREDYEIILATLDVDRMTTDTRYCTYAMKQLLNRKRVEEYLERGKSQEEPEVPCGNYVGTIVQEADGRLRKKFDCAVGRASHNSPYMLQVRKDIKEQMEQAKAKRREQLEAQIQDAQNELENL